MESTTDNLVNNQNSNTQRVSIKDLGFEDQLKIMWGWFWRGLCVTAIATILAMLVGAIVGGIFGFVLALLGRDIESVKIYLQLLGGAIGFIIGFMSLLPLINWITRAEYGYYQIWIVKKIK